MAVAYGGDMQIDLEPKDYMPAPEKGQPFFKPNGFKTLVVTVVMFSAFMTAGWLISSTVRGPITAFWDYVWPTD